MDAATDLSMGSSVPRHDSQSGTKRRKVRKGTRSCWECKRRKIRCTFSKASDTVCIGCLRRGTECLGQEFPEENVPTASSANDRIVRVEALIQQLVKQVSKGSHDLTDGPNFSPQGEQRRRDVDLPTPGSSDGTDMLSHSRAPEGLRVSQTYFLRVS